jgi:hypothetical protein
MPAYRDIEYTVVHGLGRNVWKWSVNLDKHPPTVGQTMTRAEAISRAERAIDRALAVKKVRIEPPEDG